MDRLFILVSSTTEKEKVLGYNFGPMGATIKVVGLKTNQMVMVDTCMKMEKLMKENGKINMLKVKEHFTSWKVEFWKVSGRVTFNTEKDRKNGLMAPITKVSIRTA